MNGFYGLQIDWEDGVVYIHEENGSGTKHPAENIEEVITHVSEYLRAIGE